MAKIGIIGGSGLEDPGLFADADEITIATPHGATATSITTGLLKGLPETLPHLQKRDWL